MTPCRCSLLVAAFAAVSALAAGCGGPHLSAKYGESYEAWFAAQHQSHPAGPPRALEGLDAQEAAAVSKGYRRNTAAKGDEAAAGQGQILMVGAPRGGGEGYLPPPSVPGGN